MTAFNTSRAIPAPVEQVFAAISDPAWPVRWWGPAGFTNTFEACLFRPGGSWLFTLHGPDGQDYSNESRFAEIEAPTRVVVEHVCEPRFRLTSSSRHRQAQRRCPGRKFSSVPTLPSMSPRT